MHMCMYGKSIFVSVVCVCVNMLYSLQLLPYLLCRNGLSFKHPGKLYTHTHTHIQNEMKDAQTNTQI